MNGCCPQYRGATSHCRRHRSAAPYDKHAARCSTYEVQTALLLIGNVSLASFSAEASGGADALIADSDVRPQAMNEVLIEQLRPTKAVPGVTHVLRDAATPSTDRAFVAPERSRGEPARNAGGVAYMNPINAAISAERPLAE